MFLRALLLVHKPGTTFEEISVLNEAQLETEASDFTMSTECPNVIAEEFEQSQKDEEAMILKAWMLTLQMKKYPKDLLVQPELDQEPHVQEDWQECLGLMAHHEHPHVEDGQGDYSNKEGLNMDYDWQEDSRLLRLSEEDKRGLQGWLNMTKIMWVLKKKTTQKLVVYQKTSSKNWPMISSATTLAESSKTLRTPPNC
jgi:hypothetical protein